MHGRVQYPGLADSHSRGLFAGLSLEGGVIVSRPDVNRKFYGRQVSVRWVSFSPGTVRCSQALCTLHKHR